MSQQIKHIAVIRLSAMGDVAMTVPVLYALAKQHPGLRITRVSRPFFKPLFDGIPNLEFFAFEANGKHKGFLGVIRFFSELKKTNVDVLADLHNVVRTKIISALFMLSGVRTASVNKGRAEQKALTRIQNKIFAPLVPKVERHVRVFNTLGIEVDLRNASVLPKMNMDHDVISLSGIHGDLKWIGIAPFAKHVSKVYPTDLMKETIVILAQNPKHKIFLFGAGNDEVAVLNSLASAKQNVVVVAGKISFAQELQLISNLDVMLSMDSGNAHISAMFGVDTITLWGATHPYSGFSPFGQPLENAIVSDRSQFPDLPTSVYGNKKVKGYEHAMRTIIPAKIAQRIESLLSD